MEDLPSLAALLEGARALRERIDAVLEKRSESDLTLRELREELIRIKRCLRALEKHTPGA